MIFGFLQLGKAIVSSQSAYDPMVHLRLSSATDPTYIVVNIKAIQPFSLLTVVVFIISSCYIPLWKGVGQVKQGKAMSNVRDGAACDSTCK